MVYCSHGDTKHIMLLPASVEECFDMAYDAFDLSERFQTPIFVMSDLDLGMNNWMSDPFKYPDEEIRSRQGADCRRSAEARQASNAMATSTATESLIARCPARIIRAAAYFTRGSGHNENALYSETPGRLQEQHGSPEQEVRNGARTRASAGDRLREGRKNRLPRVRHDALGDYRIAGSAAEANTTCRVSYYRLRAVPFTKHLVEFFEKHDRVYVVEQNRDGQMAMLVKLELPVRTDRQNSQHPALQRDPDRCPLRYR